jgi:hypothetical protein
MRIWAVIFCLALVGARAFGNGGTFDTSAIERTGNLEPVRQTKVTLADEVLKVKLDGEFAEVSVDYTLVNRGGGTTMSYGFPVDVGMSWIETEKGSLDFAILDNGQRLPIERVIEKANETSVRQRLWKNDGETTSTRKWHLVSLKFSPRETKHLSVRYRVKNAGQMSGISTMVFFGHTPIEFLYALSPSATWGAGKVGRLVIEVDASRLRDDAAPVTGISLPGYTEQDGVYRWELHDFDLRKANDFRFTYDLQAKMQSEEALRELLPREAVGSIEVSSTREPSRTTKVTYGAANLLDRDFSTAWIEGAADVGKSEWIEVRINKGWALRSMALANGYWKSAQRLAENGCIRKVRVDWDWEDSDGTKKYSGHETKTVELKRPAYGPAMLKFPYGVAEVLEEFGERGGTGCVRKVRLTILDAEPGSADTDTAVSELILLGEKR